MESASTLMLHMSLALILTESMGTARDRRRMVIMGTVPEFLLLLLYLACLCGMPGALVGFTSVGGVSVVSSWSGEVVGD